MTAAGYTQEKGRMAQGPGDPLKLIATHNLQVAVYTGGKWASVDDIWVDNSVTLDPATHRPNGSPANLIVEDSAALQLVSGRWLVGDIGRFGVNREVAGENISYAAVADGAVPPPAITEQIAAAFQHYESVRDSAYLALDSSSLASVESGAALAADTKAIAQETAMGQTIRFQDQSSYRVALQNATTAWIYDTVGDQSESINPRTGAPLQRVSLDVERAVYRLTKGVDGWSVDFSATA
jgi:hypothetical protein